MTNSPMVCAISQDVLPTPRGESLALIARLSIRAVKIAAGYRFEFAPEPEVLRLIADMIDDERQCCRFLRFSLAVEPEAGPIWLEVTGPRSAQEFLEALLEPA
jgi:hypothetical protein